MNRYLDHLETLYDPKTFQRKVDYIKYNFSPYFKLLNSKSTILEIGPGYGEFISFLNSQGITNIDILDNSKDVLKYNKSRYKIKKTFNSFDCKLRKYNLIFMLQVLEHIPKTKYKAFLQTLYSCLLPQGQIIITVPNGASLLGLSERYNDLQHEASFTEISLQEIPNYCEIPECKIAIQGYKIPPVSLINILRIIAQKILHFFISILYIINAGVYCKIYHPNISLIIKKIRL